MTAEPLAKTAPARSNWLRRHRSALVVGVALIAATAIGALGGSTQRYTATLDPGNADRGGARAVARVLADQGIDVAVVRSADAFTRTTFDDRTTVLITSTENLGQGTARQVLDRSSGAEIVLVDPVLGVPALFNLQDGRSYSRTRVITASCADERFAGLRVETRSGSLFPAVSGGCFTEGAEALLTWPTDRLTVLGAGDLLSNEQIRRADNAAVALRLLGNTDRLVWYVPDAADLTGADGVGLGTLLPEWIGPGLVLLAAAAIALILWRSRRLGPLAIEPLPVSVTAIETTRSRARLYRKVNDRAHAADALRTATRTAMAEHLHLPPHYAADLEALASTLSPYTALTRAQLLDLLSPTGPVPGSDKELITLANTLAALSREVRSP